jgi:hypothetical protein
MFCMYSKATVKFAAVIVDKPVHDALHIPLVQLAFGALGDAVGFAGDDDDLAVKLMLQAWRVR